MLCGVSAVAYVHIKKVYRKLTAEFTGTTALQPYAGTVVLQQYVLLYDSSY